MNRYPTNSSSRLWPFGVALLLCIAFGAFAAADNEAEADREDAAAISSRDWAAQQVCQGRPFTWEDDKTLVCHRELP